MANAYIVCNVSHKTGVLAAFRQAGLEVTELEVTKPDTAAFYTEARFFELGNVIANAEVVLTSVRDLEGALRALVGRIV